MAVDIARVSRVPISRYRGTAERGGAPAGDCVCLACGTIPSVLPLVLPLQGSPQTNASLGGIATCVFRLRYKYIRPTDINLAKMRQHAPGLSNRAFYQNTASVPQDNVKPKRSTRTRHPSPRKWYTQQGRGDVVVCGCSGKDRAQLRLCALVAA